MFNSLKTAFVVLLLTGMSATATAGVQVGVSSDNYFRGHNISDGVGYPHLQALTWTMVLGRDKIMSADWGGPDRHSRYDWLRL